MLNIREALKRQAEIVKQVTQPNKADQQRIFFSRLTAEQGIS